MSDVGVTQQGAVIGAGSQEGSREGGWASRMVSGLKGSEFWWRPAAILLFLCVWQAFATINQHIKVLNPLFVIPPLALRHTFMRQWNDGILFQDVAASLSAVVKGYVIGSSAGLILGIASGYIRIVQRLWDPIVQIFRSIPPFAFLPMFVLYLGIDEISRVMFIAYTVFFYTYMNAMLGVRQIDPVLIRAAQSLGASRLRIFRSIILPAAMPSVMTGLRISAGMSFFALIAAELIAANAGIGYRIMWARQYFEVDTMLFDAFLIGFLGFVVDLMMRGIEGWILRWKPQVTQS